MKRSDHRHDSMDPADDQDLLWELSAAVDERGSGPAGSGPAGSGPAGSGPAGSGSVSDETLAAYRQHRLPAEDEERVEELLAHSPEARRRLAELSGASLTAPPATAKERFLFTLPRPRRGPGGAAGGWLPRRR